MGRRGRKAAGPDQTVRAGGFAVSVRRGGGRVHPRDETTRMPNGSPPAARVPFLPPPWETFGKNFVSCLPRGGRCRPQTAVGGFRPIVPRSPRPAQSPVPRAVPRPARIPRLRPECSGDLFAAAQQSANSSGKRGGVRGRMRNVPGAFRFLFTLKRKRRAPERAQPATKCPWGAAA